MRDYLKRGGYHKVSFTLQIRNPSKPWDITVALIRQDPTNKTEELLKSIQLNPDFGIRQQRLF